MTLQAFALHEVTTKERMKQQTMKAKAAAQGATISSQRLMDLTGSLPRGFFNLLHLFIRFI